MANGTNDPAQMATERSNGWKFDKRISTDTLVAVAILAIAIGGPTLLAWKSISERMLIQETLQEQLIKHQSERDAESKERIKELVTSVQAMQIDIARLIVIQTREKK